MQPHVVLFLAGALLVVVINVFAFAFFWADKRAAQLGEWRVPESTLLFVALIGGWPGAIAGQQYWRHKTRKEPFRTMLYSIPVVYAVAIGWFLFR